MRKNTKISKKMKTNRALTAQQKQLIAKIAKKTMELKHISGK